MKLMFKLNRLAGSEYLPRPGASARYVPVTGSEVLLDNKSIAMNEAVWSAPAMRFLLRNCAVFVSVMVTRCLGVLSLC